MYNDAGLAIGGRGNIATTALTGNYRQQFSGTLRVDVEGQAASIRTDRLNVSGTARLAGTVAAELLPGTTLPPGTHSATIIRAAGGVTLDSPPVLTATPTLNTSWALSYPNPNDVNLSVTLTTTAPSARMSTNQRSVAAALNSAASSNPTGFSSYSTSVYGATNATSYSASMSSLGGDGGMASMLAAQGASHQFMMGITARLDLLQRSNDADMAAPASFAPFAFGSAFGDEGATLSGEAMLGMNSVADTMPSLTRFWAMPLGYGGRMDAGAALGTSAESRVGGFMMGFDHQVAPNLLVGAVGGYSNGSYDAGQLIARGQLEGGHMGAYAMWRSGPLYMTGALSYARHEAKQSRIIGLEDRAEYARGNSGMHNASANLEFGARFDLGGFAVSPFAGVGLNAWRQDGGTEASTAADGSGGVLGLTQQARSDHSMPISLGMRWDTTFAGPGGFALTPYVRAAWVHETRNSMTSTASFALAADQSFNLVTPRTARDRLSMNIGMQMQPHERLGFGFGIIGDVGDGVQSIGGFGRMVVRW
jgi:outer membrane autotransporter protein